MKKYLVAFTIVCMFALLATSVSATLTPATLSATLSPGASVGEHKTVFLPGTIPKGDVVFAFDLTGSMTDDIAVVKTQAVNIMNTLDTLIDDAQFGVMSFMDYNGTYTSYGYTNWYGADSAGDYPYRLDHAITSDKTLVSTTINGLVTGSGMDGPQDYTRILYESYADLTVGWRPGAKKILVMFGDNVPHDNNLKEDVPGKVGTYSTGGDPGRDEIILNVDDLDLQTVLAGMDANNVILLYVQCANPYPTDALDYWNYWTGITGGDAYQIANAAEIPAAIAALVEAEAAHVDTLTLKAEAGYEAWLTSVPLEYADIDIPAAGVTKEFDITITVPLGKAPGTYVFHIIADADGASYGEQLVTITVPFEHVIPETPFGTILASASICLGFLAYMGIPRFRRTRKIANL